MIAEIIGGICLVAVGVGMVILIVLVARGDVAFGPAPFDWETQCPELKLPREGHVEKVWPR